MKTKEFLKNIPEFKTKENHKSQSQNGLCEYARTATFSGKSCLIIRKLFSIIFPGSNI